MMKDVGAQLIFDVQLQQPQSLARSRRAASVSRKQGSRDVSGGGTSQSRSQSAA